MECVGDPIKEMSGVRVHDNETPQRALANLLSFTFIRYTYLYNHASPPYRSLGSTKGPYLSDRPAY